MSSPNRLTKLALWVLFIMGAILISAKIYTGPLRPPLAWLPNFNFSSTYIYSYENEQLAGIVKKNLSGMEGQFGVYIEDLNSDDKYEFNGQHSFPTASLYKLFLLAAVLKEVENGQLSLDDRLSWSKSALIEAYGELDFGYEEAAEIISYSVDEALMRVGRISDNFASIMLAEKIGWEKLQELANKLGVSSTVLTGDSFSTTAKDIGFYFKLLYQKRVVSEVVSSQIIEYLSLNQINNRLPAKLPPETQNQPDSWQLVHKTGELAGIRHDGGFMILSQKAYVIVILSKDLKYEDEAIEAMANLSKEVFEYFKEKSGPTGN
ncbi:MAG: serine hydrolase [Candidatus Daviesbacteria bacterium]|nr:serine hydrolase [Candidatus Daviesbacteria bacterium]